MALGLLGGCLSFLYKSRQDCEDTIDLARTFLVEVAIFDSTFAGRYARELGGIEFLDRVERNPRSKSPIGEYDKAFGLNAAWAKEETADEHVNQAKLRVEREDLPSEHLNLIHEEKVRLSRHNHDLEFDYNRSSIIQEHIAQDTRLDKYSPVSLEGIKNTLKKWDDAGRHLGWQPLAVRRRQEFDRLDAVANQAVASNLVEDCDFAEILWTGGEGYRRMRKWYHAHFLLLFLLCTYFAGSECALSAESWLSEKVNTRLKPARHSHFCTYFRAFNLHINVSINAPTNSETALDQLAAPKR